jgi:hypothetical protein
MLLKAHHLILKVVVEKCSAKLNQRIAKHSKITFVMYLLMPLLLQRKGLRRNQDAMENKSWYHKNHHSVSCFVGK